MIKKMPNLVGQSFGRLTVISSTRIDGRLYWNCACACGATTCVKDANLTRGRTASCGCLRKETTSKRAASAPGHRMIHSPEYCSWTQMKSRCSNPKVKGYERYGGRGISVCDRWLNFVNFFKDIGTRPSCDHSIERINNSLGYFPENCKWATRIEQGSNKRNNVNIEAYGRKMCVTEWSRFTGIKADTIRARLKRGWDHERIVIKPAPPEDS